VRIDHVIYATADLDAATARVESELGLQVQAGGRHEGWVVAVDDVHSVARRLGTTVTTIRRAGLSARLAGLAEAMYEQFLPAFISRGYHVDRGRGRLRPLGAVAGLLPAAGASR
jgi:hypothetical protein